MTFIVFVKPHAGSIPQGLLLKGDLYNVGLIVLCRLCKSSAFDLKTPTFINGKTELFQGICMYKLLVLVNAVLFHTLPVSFIDSIPSPSINGS